jgi:hypothetical protein
MWPIPDKSHSRNVGATFRESRFSGLGGQNPADSVAGLALADRVIVSSAGGA